MAVFGTIIFYLFYVVMCFLSGYGAATVSFTAWNLVLPYMLNVKGYDMFGSLFLSVLSDLVSTTFLTLLYGYKKKILWVEGCIFGLIQMPVAVLTAYYLNWVLANIEVYLKGGIAFFPFLIMVIYFVRFFYNLNKERKEKKLAEAEGEGEEKNVDENVDKEKGETALKDKRLELIKGDHVRNRHHPSRISLVIYKRKGPNWLGQFLKLKDIGNKSPPTSPLPPIAGKPEVGEKEFEEKEKEIEQNVVEKDDVIEDKELDVTEGDLSQPVEKEDIAKKEDDVVKKEDDVVDDEKKEKKEEKTEEKKESKGDIVIGDEETKSDKKEKELLGDVVDSASIKDDVVEETILKEKKYKGNWMSRFLLKIYDKYSIDEGAGFVFNKYKYSTTGHIIRHSIFFFMMIFNGFTGGFIFNSGGLILNITIQLLYRQTQTIATANGCYIAWYMIVSMVIPFFINHEGYSVNIFTVDMLIYSVINVVFTIIGSVVGCFSVLIITDTQIYLLIAVTMLVLGIVCTITGVLQY